MAFTNNNGQTRVGVRIVPLSVVIPTPSALLDSYSGASAAYSLRKLSATYTGSAIRVRRSSDNTEQNIGFDSGGNLDTVALSTFVGSGNGFVTTWYDQSGNSRNVAQTTAANQPRIVNTGAIELLNGKVCFSNYGQNQWLQLNSFGSNIASVFSFAMVGSVGNDSFRVALKFNPPSTGNNSKLQVNGFASLTSLEMQGSSSIYYSFPGVMNTTIPHIIQGTFNSTTSEFSVNNQTLLTGNAGPSTLNGIIIGADWNGAYPTSGKYQEVVVWGVNKSSDRSGINTSLNTYYSVYPNPTSVWNLLNAVYSADTTASSSLKTSLFAAYNGESNTNDSFGTNNGTAVGGLTYTTGKIGNAFDFNGTNAYVGIPNTSGQLDFTGDFSISTWVMPYVTSASYNIYFSNYKAGGTYGSGFVFFLDRTVNKLSFSLRNQTNISIYGYSWIPLVNTWYHLTVTRKASTGIKLYINGVEVVGSFNPSFSGVTLNPTYQSGQIYNIGSTLNGDNLGNYRQDAVNIWNKELTASEVSELYNSGNGAQYITDNFYKPTTNDALNTYNGTAQGGLTWGVGKVGTAFVGNGTNAYVSLPNNSFNFTGSMSINMWVNISSSTTRSTFMGNYYYVSGGRDYGWIFEHMGNGTLRFYMQTAGNSSVIVSTSYSGKYNSWKMITITKLQNSTLRLYIDGVLITTNYNTPDIYYNTTNYSTVCGYISSSVLTGPLENGGKVDAVGIWNRELSQAEVTELYNSGNGKQYPN